VIGEIVTSSLVKIYLLQFKEKFTVGVLAFKVIVLLLDAPS